MNAALGVLALLWLGVDGAPREAAPNIVYEFRVLEMAGVEWREGVYASLQPVTHQGSATVWMTSARVAETLAKKANGVVAAPKVTALATAPAHFSTKVSRRIATPASRAVDETGDGAAKAGYAAEAERIRAGFAATVSGRRLDQGVLVQVVFDDTQVTAVHPVYLAGFDTSKEAGDSKPARAEHVQVKLEVPEVLHNELAGEWLIPNGGVLVASLGAHSVADDHGKAVVHERLVLVKASAVVPSMVASTASGGKVVFEQPAGVPMPAPSAPSRTLPQGIDADGEPVPMPVAAETAAPTSRPDSDEPVATPQTKHHSGAKSPDAAPTSKGTDGPADRELPAGSSTVDPAADKTSYSPESAPRADLPRTKAPLPRALKTCPTAAACCDSSAEDLPPLPDPLPEAAVTSSTAPRSAHHEHGPLPDPLPEAAANAQQVKRNDVPADLRKRITAMLEASEGLRIRGKDWERFLLMDATTDRSDDCQDDQAPAPPAQAYRFRMPLDGADLEIRIVPRRGQSPSRATWRASGSEDSVKN